MDLKIEQNFLSLKYNVIFLYFFEYRNMLAVVFEILKHS